MTVKLAIIDDDEAVRDSFQVLLESYGYVVTSYPSAEDFLLPPRLLADCLLVDQHMPGMTGLDMLEKLRAEGDQTPALMITGRNEKGLAARLAPLSVEFLPKPVREEVLMYRIKEVLQPS